MENFELGTSGNTKRMCGNDCVMTVAHLQIGRQTRTAQGALRQDVMAAKRTWKFDYSWIPGQTSRTFDGGLGRDALKALMDSKVELTMLLPSEGVRETVLVLFDLNSWHEELIERDGLYGWTYALSFVLAET